MISVIPFIKAFSITFSPSTAYDTVLYKIHAVPASDFVNGDFTPSESNLINEGPETSFFYKVSKGGEWGVKIAAVDTFGDDELNYSAMYTTMVPTLDPLDTIAPPVPTWKVDYPSTTLVTVGAGAESAIDFMWELSEYPADLVGYILAYRREGLGLWSEVTLKANSYKLEGCIPGVVYEAKICAFDQWNNTSSWSASASIQAFKDSSPPGRVTSLSAEGGIGCVKLKWVNPTDTDIKATKVYRAATTAFEDAIEIAELVSTTYTDSTALTGVLYNYWVVVYDYSGNEGVLSLMVTGGASAILPKDLDASSRVDFVLKDSLFVFDHAETPLPASTDLRWTQGTIIRGTEPFTLAAGTLAEAHNKYIVASLASGVAALTAVPYGTAIGADQIILALTSTAALAETNNYVCYVRQANSMAIEGAIIRDATISSAKISNLSANKITTGTLDCGLLEVKNLNFSDLEGGITWGTISDRPTFLSQINASEGSRLTYIGATGLYSGTVSADRLVAGNFSSSMPVGYTGSILIDGVNSQITVMDPDRGSINMVTLGVVGVDYMFQPTYGIKISNHLGQPVFKVDASGVTIQNLTSGSINADLVTIDNLVVGKNVVMGTDATINWGNIEDIPQFKTSELIDDAGFGGAVDWSTITNKPNTTYIASTGIYTGTLIAQQVMATNFVALAANIGSAAISTASIQDAAITSAKVSDIQSDNFVAGSTGWRIKKSGAAEFSSVNIRGAVHATSLTTDSAIITNAMIQELAVGTSNIKPNSIGVAQAADFTPAFNNLVMFSGSLVMPTAVVCSFDITIDSPGNYQIFASWMRAANLAYGTEEICFRIDRSANGTFDGIYEWPFYWYGKMGGSLDGITTIAKQVYLSPDLNWNGVSKTHRITMFANTYYYNGDTPGAGSCIAAVNISVFGAKR